MKITRWLTVSQLAFLPTLFPVNCYIVEEDGGLTLIDAALPSSAGAILHTAETMGKPITRIVLTHAHDDHVGSLDRLKQQLPGVEVYISERDSKLLSGDRSLLPGEPDTPIRGGVPKKVQTKADVLLRDGDKVGSLLALSAPGHTPGSMAFLDTRSGALIAGDAFQTRGGIAVTGHLKPFFPFPAMATWNSELALESARKLRAHSPVLLATGHGRMIESPGALMDQAIQNAEKYLQKKKQAV